MEIDAHAKDNTGSLAAPRIFGLQPAALPSARGRRREQLVGHGLGRITLGTMQLLQPGQRRIWGRIQRVQGRFALGAPFHVGRYTREQRPSQAADGKPLELGFIRTARRGHGSTPESITINATLLHTRQPS
jgi:hypothetical protein